MQSILQKLYYGGLDPQSTRSYPLPWEPFYSCLKAQSPELEKKCSVLMSNVNQAYIADTEEMFHYGFGLAVKLLAEGLSY